VKTRFGLDPNKSFEVSEEVLSHYRRAVARGRDLESKWNSALTEYGRAFSKEVYYSTKYDTTSSIAI
jgi:dihydroxyacetone synthase